ncbi:histidinol-phosphate transaminase [Bacillaceae bacterium]
MIPKARIQGLLPYQPGKPIEEVKRELGLTDVIKLASNENPFGFSPRVREAIAQEIGLLHIYPDGASSELRSALAAFLGVGEEELIFGNGSDEVVQLICRAFLEPGDRTITAAPTFPQYRSNSVIEGAEVVEIPLKDGVHDLAAMGEAIDDKTKIVWICNPNNPSGTIVTEDELTGFLDGVPERVLVVLDEAYYEYVTDERYPDSLALLARYPNLVVLRTFSKAYGIAALRIGYGIAGAKIIDLLNRVREPFNNTRLSQKAALAALQDQEFIALCREKNRQGREQLYAGFAKLGLSFYPSQGNFVLVDVKRPADEVFQGLLRRGIIVRSGSALGFPTGLRITVGSEEQNEKLLTALSEVLATVKAT